ncbi:MAG: 16S rRNA (uracil(1498)-N(3))-methyltransferase [Clostridia bacterium]|nr:16S rRNA (uracil(1498)-N(3))-methyltransferase [Clostridia bacterium]
MYKFFVKDDQINDNKIQIIGKDVNHIKNVLRLQKDEAIQVCNIDTSKSYITKIVELSNDDVLVEIVEECNESTETKILVHIFQGLPKQEKMEIIIQKATEIGVSGITPVKMERCVVKLDEKTASKKIERWQKIAEVAAKQSKRDKIPIVHSCINLKSIYEKLKEYDIVIMAYEEEKENSIKQILTNLSHEKELKIAVIIGPEGGISKEEVELLNELPNLKTVTLGKRILRTETAPLVLASVIMYEFDEME